MDPKDAPKPRPVDHTEEAAEAAKARKRARGEGYPRVPDGGKYITLASIRRHLEECQRSLDDTAALLPDLIRERNRLLATNDQNALRTWYQNAGERTTRQYRLNEHNTLKEAQMLMEDFLYYQNQTHRRERAAIYQTKSKLVTWDLSGQRGSYMMIQSANPPQTQNIIDTFDDHQIGGPLHRQGLIDWDGKPTAEEELDPQPKLVRPNELHLWTPVFRRVPAGFGVTQNGPMVPTRLQLDADAISEKCRRTEQSTLRDEGLPYQTHAQRRQQELEMYRDDKTNGMTTMGYLNRMRTREGVFIAALESSYDWPTSYDSLGSVCDSVHPNFTISAERETIDAPDGDSVQTQESSQVHGGPDQAVSEPTPSKRRKSVHKTVFSTRKRSRKGVTRPKEPQAPVTIDYPYPVNEFQDTIRERWPILVTETNRDHAPVSTVGREKASGRRERHDYMLLSPASPTDSPLHTPSE